MATSNAEKAQIRRDNMKVSVVEWLQKKIENGTFSPVQQGLVETALVELDYSKNVTAAQHVMMRLASLIKNGTFDNASKIKDFLEVHSNS